MSLIFDILDDLWNSTLYYKGIPVNVFGFPKYLISNKSSYRSTVYQLTKKDFIRKYKGGWLITPKGKKYLDSYEGDLMHFPSPFKKADPKNLIVMFDVPIEKNKHRDWLRRQLKEFDYVMVQQSVWVGPSPLPKEFKDYMKMLKIEKNIKTFKLAKNYKI
jgi:CRISPR-associated endonuclease Cas2